MPSFAKSKKTPRNPQSDMANLETSRPWEGWLVERRPINQLTFYLTPSRSNIQIQRIYFNCLRRWGRSFSVFWMNLEKTSTSCHDYSTLKSSPTCQSNRTAQHSCPFQYFNFTQSPTVYSFYICSSERLRTSTFSFSPLASYQYSKKKNVNYYLNIISCV